MVPTSLSELNATKDDIVEILGYIPADSAQGSDLCNKIQHCFFYSIIDITDLRRCCGIQTLVCQNKSGSNLLFIQPQRSNGKCGKGRLYIGDIRDRNFVFIYFVPAAVIGI